MSLLRLIARSQVPFVTVRTRRPENNTGRVTPGRQLQLRATRRALFASRATNCKFDRRSAICYVMAH